VSENLFENQLALRQHFEGAIVELFNSLYAKGMSDCENILEILTNLINNSAIKNTRAINLVNQNKPYQED
jgi:hypothetical protein